MILLRLVQSRSTCPPLGLAYLASSLRTVGHDVSVIDSVGESIFQFTEVNNGKNLAHGLTIDQIVEKIDPNSDFLCFSCMFSIEWPLNYQLIKKANSKYPNKTIIVGGEHVTASYEWLLKNCPEVDFCVLGEGEVKLVNLINSLSNSSTRLISSDKEHNLEGVVSREYHRPKREGPVDKYLRDLRIHSIDDIPLPAWDLIPLNNYLDNNFGYGIDRGRNMPMLATRGCPYQCTFCSSPQMWSTTWSARSPEKVLDEMEAYIVEYKAENFSFYDLTAIVKKDWIIDFCKLILQRKLNFTWQLPSGTRSEAFDEEVIDLMYRTGCRNLNFAPESGSPSVLKRIKKRVNLKEMKKSMKRCVKRGLVVKSNTIIGFPEETHFEIFQTLGFIARIAWIGVHETTISGYIPYPGTEIYDSIRKLNKIPAFSDKYFWSLATTSDIFNRTSHSDKVSHRAISIYTIIGLLIFYSISFIRRPYRLFKAIYNISIGKEEGRIEASLKTLYKRFNPFRKQKEYL